jgi:hypothetical protein
MSRIPEWTAYLFNNFGLTTRFVKEDSGDWARALFHCSIDRFNGVTSPERISP